MPLRSLILTALFAALTAAGAFLRVPVGDTSFTLQVLFTCMAGVLLGPRYGALSQLLYLALGLVGLPVFTAGGGPTYIFQPTFGFLLGLAPMALAVGLLTRRDPSPRRIAGACLLGLAALYLVAMPYLWLILNVYLDRAVSPAALVSVYMLPFLPFDGLKIAAAALLCPRLRRALPQKTR